MKSFIEDLLKFNSMSIFKPPKYRMAKKNQSAWVSNSHLSAKEELDFFLLVLINKLADAHELNKKKTEIKYKECKKKFAKIRQQKNNYLQQPFLLKKYKKSHSRHS